MNSFDHLAAQYLSGALVIALVLTAIAAIYRIVQHIIRHQRATGSKDDGVVRVAELAERASPELRQARLTNSTRVRSAGSILGGER